MQYDSLHAADTCPSSPNLYSSITITIISHSNQLYSTLPSLIVDDCVLKPHSCITSSSLLKPRCTSAHVDMATLSLSQSRSHSHPSLT